MPDETFPIPSRYVFVYGTLRRGGSNDITQLTPRAKFVGEATVCGSLYDLGAYPGVALHLKDTSEAGDLPVHGEVYAISADLEARLDVIEGLLPEPNGEYIKRQIAVVVKGESLQCLIYEINPDHLLSAPLIAHGDWMLGRRH
ncbi:gamma-glutamylcyclotransferase family protein [Acidovorax sp. SUPP3334]|uniref:gamma-glutamylcyclotransferase family protein n=1 Tax=Acidovorax sp. SUPP3334 TaxID=2920881 RepID=UPI0023DE6516|nr:gamma-glutamylcyclotransferase family protein [Acidovorax sp. SUPP3334]GKT23745.1 gamma-glutamylcyclotransferase [Acidovorax sp. SUPP3334]